MAKVGSFIRGLRGENATLDEVLAGKVVDRKYRLIDLTRANVHYNAATGLITVRRPNAAMSPQIQVREPFLEYMRKYGDSVRYVTRGGTPWLTDAEKNDPQKVSDYYDALAAGPKTDLAIINWRKTDGLKGDTGHSAVSVGQLAWQEDPAARPANDDSPLPIRQYEQHIGGSFYPSQSLWRDRKNRATTMKEAFGLDTGEDPSSHARGILIRNSLKPTAAALAAGGTAYATSRGMKGTRMLAALRTATVVGLGYGAGYTTGVLQSSAGSIKIKDEKRGHGILATLVTPAQHDVMEHTLAGLNKTYYGYYNILRSNCADFAEDMMGMIGLNVQEVVQAAMVTKPGPGHVRRGITARIGARIIPSHIRPDRNRWAIGVLESGLEGITEIDDQQVYMRNFDISGQSTLLIEGMEGAMFHCPPIEMLSKVLNKAVSVTAPNGDWTNAIFTYQSPHVTLYPRSEKEMSRAR